MQRISLRRRGESPGHGGAILAIQRRAEWHVECCVEAHDQGRRPERGDVMVELDCDQGLEELARAPLHAWLRRVAPTLDPDGQARIRVSITSLDERARVEIECGGVVPPLAADVSAEDVRTALALAFEWIRALRRSPLAAAESR